MNAFPVDESTLALIDAALDTSRTGRTSLSALLDLLSGYDPSKLQPVYDEDGRAIPDVVIYPDFIWHPYDVILALMAEVRRLRGAPDVSELAGVDGYEGCRGGACICTEDDPDDA